MNINLARFIVLNKSQRKSAGQEVVMQAIENKGWFVYTLSGLATGDASVANERSMWSADKIRAALDVLYGTGFARHSRKGWLTAQHPDLGLVQWKSGTDFRTVGNYFFLRVNGKPILNAWPKAGSSTTAVKWMAGNSLAVEDKLGHLHK